MNPCLLGYLCDPVDKSALKLVDARHDQNGKIIEGTLVSAVGRRYPIRAGIPRFGIEDVDETAVEAFGDEWNYFNFDEFKLNWLEHTVRNTFGSADVFRDKVILDAGGGSGIQSRWMSEAGARHVICLELSHSVDGVMKENLRGFNNVDLVQGSIDHPPIKDEAVSGIVICHNVIQHTRSVEETARALWSIVGKGGEFVFNCYQKNDQGLVRKLRFWWYEGLRAILSRCPFIVRLGYARLMSALRFIPVLGLILEKSMLVIRGNVPDGPNYVRRAYKMGVLNTFDYYGAHRYQHHKEDDEIRALVTELQPEKDCVANMERYFSRPPPAGLALRLRKG